MASNYPSGLDSFTNPAGTDNLSAGIGHAAQHANANDAIEAIEGELGLNPRGGSATVKARFDAIEANSWVTSARILDGTIVNGDVSASAAIDPSKVAQNVVTFSNADAVVATSTRKLAQIGTMSASRTVTLPAASGVPAGTELVVADLSGSVTTTNTIVVSRAGSDTVNGTTSVAIGAAYGMRRLISDGTSKWSVDGGVVRLSDVGTITSTMIADATITGTDIASGTVTSTNILDGTIVNGDISASAAIVGTKLADGAITPIKTSGGYVAKTALYTATNDDRIIDCTTGTYTITLPTAASQTGRTFIIRNSGTGTITIGRTGAETISGATSQTLAGYGYLQVVSNGTNWLVLGGTYADEAIGRRIYTWNSAYSSGTGGWQQTYGDTGDRNAAITYTNNWANSYGVDRLRRIGNTVYLVVALDSTNATADAAFTVPSGFRPTLAAITSIVIGGGSNVPRTMSLGSDGVGTIYRASLTPQGGWQLTVAYPTNDAWPASLPGSASGSIPT